MIFDSISSNIDEVLSINPSADVFVFGDFNVHHKDWLTCSGGTDKSGELCYNFSISNDLIQMGNVPTQIPDRYSHGTPFCISFFLLTLVFILQWLSLHQEILIMLMPQFPLTFHHNDSGIPHCIAMLMATFALIGVVFMIIWEMFHWMISLNSVLLLLLVNFVSGFRLESMYICLLESIRSSLSHLNGFQLLVLLAWFIEITYFVCT